MYHHFGTKVSDLKKTASSETYSPYLSIPYSERITFETMKFTFLEGRV